MALWIAREVAAGGRVMVRRKDGEQVEMALPGADFQAEPLKSGRGRR